jgi:hypothetical protein
VARRRRRHRHHALRFTTTDSNRRLVQREQTIARYAMGNDHGPRSYALIEPDWDAATTENMFRGTKLAEPLGIAPAPRRRTVRAKCRYRRVRRSWKGPIGRDWSVTIGTADTGWVLH